jgi:hypothetical protein
MIRPFSRTFPERFPDQPSEQCHPADTDYAPRPVSLFRYYGDDDAHAVVAIDIGRPSDRLRPTVRAYL